MTFELTILGSNSALPTPDRHPSAQVIQYNNSTFLIDCGEGTQIQMSRFKVKRGKMDHIFISHLHGDHYYGLIGLITTFHLNRREHELNIYGPEGLEDIIRTHLKYSGTKLFYPLNFHLINPEKKSKLLETKEMTVTAFPLDHRIACTGFLFEEKEGLRHLIPAKLAEYKVPVDQMQGLKEGKDLVLPDGSTVPNDEMTNPPYATRRYAYCSDTAYNPDLAGVVEGVDLLYHEATFMESEIQRAADTKHSTARQAAQLARDAKVKHLVLGHFSSRYGELQSLLAEAREVFSATELGLEGKVIAIPREG